MARKRNAKGQFVKKNKGSSTRRRKRSVRKHTIRVSRGPVQINRRRRAARINPKRRRRSVTVRGPMLINRRRRHAARINPSFGSLFSMGTLKTVGFTAGGFLGVPFVEAYVNKMIPAVSDPTMQKVIKYAVKIGTAWALGFGVGKVAGKDAGQKVLVGGLANVALTAVKDLGLLGVATSTTPSASRYLANQPLLGAYPGMGSAITTRTADRLNPANRF